MSTTTTAILATAFLNSIGVNTHLDFAQYKNNIPVVENSINYLGVKNLRDSGVYSFVVPIWSQVSAATGAKFLDYLPRLGPSDDVSALNLAPQLAAAGVLNSIEGVDEPDAPNAIADGNSLSWSATF